MRWIPCLIWMLVTPCLGDILHLRDGSRYHGQLIRESDSQVVFRVMADATTGVVRTFPRQRVARIERGDADSAAPAGNATEPAEDFVQMYREAVELFYDRELRSALLALQRLVNRAPRETLSELNDRVLEEHGETLPELLATLRMQQALDNRKGLFQLRYASRYEAPALSSKLAQLHDSLLEKPFHENSLRIWMEQPALYATLQPDAPDMVRDLRILAGVLGSRLKIDRSLHEERAARRQLALLRTQASALVAQIEAMPGYTNLRSGRDADDPTLAAARNLRTTSQPGDADEMGPPAPPEEDRDGTAAPDGPAEPAEPG